LTQENSSIPTSRGPFAASNLPSWEEFVLIILPNIVDSRTDDDIEKLIGGIADEELRRTLFRRYQTWEEASYLLGYIWYTLKCLEKPRQQFEVHILLYAATNLFYSFWNMCGKIVDCVFDLGQDYKENAPSIRRILGVCRDKKEADPLIDLMRSRFESQVQKEIVGVRDEFIHRLPPSFGDFDRVIDLRVMDDLTWKITEPRHKYTENEMYDLLKRGLLELLEFHPLFRDRFTALNRELDISRRRE
jgi:hypothetical protein